MMKMISKMLSYWDSENIALRGKKILCALSGGADSVAMLHLLREVAGRMELDLCAAHFDHRLRGEESVRDSMFSQKLCESLGISIIRDSADVAAYARENAMGIEQAARELRYGFLQTAAAKTHADCIATAHNADDNAETVIMHLLRGTGTRGLGGIPPVRGNIVRPVLCFTGDELRQYLTRRGIDHVEDSTNGEDEYLRNRIRHGVMPLLTQLEPSFSTHVLNTSALCREDDTCLNEAAQRFLDKGTVIAPALCALESPVAARVLRLWLGEDLSAERVRKILALAKSGTSGKRVELPGHRTVRLEQGVLTLISEQNTALAQTRLEWGVNRIPCWEIKVQLYEGGPIRQTPYCIYLKDRHEPLSVRSRKTGDALDLPFRGGRKLLKKLFIDEKVPLSKRDSIPVLLCGEQAAAVPGFGISEEFRLHFGESGYIITFREV